jgi:hypothetical protein
MDGVSDADIAALRTATSDNDVSDMLSVVARNEDGASALVYNDEDRQLLLGMNWYDDGGATDVINSATDRDPEGGGGGMAQAMATQRLMQEVGGDRDFYLGRMTEGMSDAVVDSGINWMDTFGRPATSDTPSNAGYYDDALGHERLGVQLSASDRANFLQFVSGSGLDSDGHPDGDAMRFRAASVTYSEQLVADALKGGNATTVDSALATAGRMDGAITAADYEYHLDRTGDDHDEAQAAYEAARDRNWGYALASKVGVTVVSQGINLATGGAAGPFTAVGGSIINPMIDQVFDAGDPPVDQTPRTREELFNTDQIDYTARRNYFMLSAYERADLVPPPGQTGDYADVYQRDGSLVDYDTVVRDPDLINQVQVAQDASQQAWQGGHQHATIGVAEYYDAERNGIANGSYWHDEPHNSGWDDDDTARVRLYGERNVDDLDELDDLRVPVDPGEIYRGNF